MAIYWVFSTNQLDQALAAFEARRQKEGRTEQQARDETTLIKVFLISDEAADAKLAAGKGWQSRRG